MVNIRPFNPADAEYEKIVELGNIVSPENPTSVEATQHRDNVREPQYLHQRLVVELDEKIVALASYGESPWSHLPGKYNLDINVHPDYRRRGIGTAIYDHITETLDRREPKPHLLTAGTRESKTDAVQFLEKRGFEKVMHWVISYLDVTAFDPAKYAAIASNVAEQGIVIRSFAELEGEAPVSSRRKYYALDCACSEDEPNPGPLTLPTFEVFSRQVFDSPNFHPDGLFIALDGDDFVGMAGVMPNEEIPGEYGTEFAGTIRSHRRRGIASALKLRCINYAKGNGATRIKTGNEQKNPMLQLNLKFGFESVDASLAFEKNIV